MLTEASSCLEFGITEYSQLLPVCLDVLIKCTKKTNLGLNESSTEVSSLDWHVDLVSFHLWSFFNQSSSCRNLISNEDGSTELSHKPPSPLQVSRYFGTMFSRDPLIPPISTTSIHLTPQTSSQGKQSTTIPTSSS